MYKNPSALNGIRSRLSTAPKEEQHPIRNINSTYANAIVPKKEHYTFFDKILQGMRMRQLNS